MDVDVDEGGHEELAVEPVHDAAVPRNDIAKILNETNTLDPNYSESKFRQHFQIRLTEPGI